MGSGSDGRDGAPPRLCPSPGSLGDAPQRHEGTKGMRRAVSLHYEGARAPAAIPRVSERAALPPDICPSPGSLDGAPQRHSGTEGSWDGAPQRHEGTKGMRRTVSLSLRGRKSARSNPLRQRARCRTTRHLPVTGIVGRCTTETQRHRGDEAKSLPVIARAREHPQQSLTSEVGACLIFLDSACRSRYD